MECSKPIAEEFFTWAKAEYEKNPVSKSMFGVALIYAVRQEGWPMNVFLDGRLELSNNRVERAVRPFAVGRKNWLFYNTPKGADARTRQKKLCKRRQATVKETGTNQGSVLAGHGLA